MVAKMRGPVLLDTRARTGDPHSRQGHSICCALQVETDNLELNECVLSKAAAGGLMCRDDLGR